MQEKYMQKIMQKMFLANTSPKYALCHFLVKTLKGRNALKYLYFYISLLCFNFMQFYNKELS